MVEIDREVQGETWKSELLEVLEEQDHDIERLELKISQVESQFLRLLDALEEMDERLTSLERSREMNLDYRLS